MLFDDDLRIETRWSDLKRFRILSKIYFHSLVCQLNDYMNHNFTSDINSNPTEFKLEDEDRSTTQATYVHLNISYRIFDALWTCLTVHNTKYL